MSFEAMNSAVPGRRAVFGQKPLLPSARYTPWAADDSLLLIQLYICGHLHAQCWGDKADLDWKINSEVPLLTG